MAGFSVVSNKTEQIVSLHFLFFILQLLETHIVDFVKKELKGFQRVLSPDAHESSMSQSEDEEQWLSRDALLKISVDFLRRMKQEELAERLQSSKNI